MSRELAILLVADRIFGSLPAHTDGLTINNLAPPVSAFASGIIPLEVGN
jgi:hypothetical protein